MIVQIRGASGSGKSTLVRQWLEQPGCVTRFLHPAKYGLNIVSPVSRPFCLLKGGVVVPGHYDAPGGGCDMIRSVDHIYDIVEVSQKHFSHVLMEGLFVSKDHRRFSERVPGALILYLDLPLEECRAAVAQRRAVLGKPEKELKKIEGDHREVAAAVKRLKAAGCKVETHSRDSAADRLRELF